MLLKDLQTLATKLATGTLFHVEKAGKAYSVDYSALAKAIIEEYADSTVGGSKQSVQAAIAALNSSLATNVFRNTIPNGTDFNTLTYTSNEAKGNKYYCGGNISSIVNKPSSLTGSQPFALDVLYMYPYVKQVLHVYGATPSVYERQQYYSSDVTWGEWVLRPTPVVASGDLSEGNSKTIDLSAYQRRLFLLIVTSGVYVVNAWGRSMIIQAIKETDYGTISIDVNSKTLTIAAASETSMLYSLIQVY